MPSLSCMVATLARLKHGLRHNRRNKKNTAAALTTITTTLAIFMLLSFFTMEDALRASPRVFFSPTSGLGNSMIALISVRQLAELLNSPFYVDWTENSSVSCGASYEDIFQKIDDDRKTLSRPCFKTCSLQLTQHTIAGSCWRALTCGTKLEIARMVMSCDCIRIRSNQFFLPVLAPHFSSTILSDFRKHASRYLQPSASIEYRVSEVQSRWKADFGVTHIIGVHVRAAFHHNGTEKGYFIPKKRVFEKVFWPCIQKVVHKLSTNEKIGLFVAADTAEARAEATTLITSHQRIIELPTPLETYPDDTGLAPKRSKQIVLDAALELLLLIRSDSLLVERMNGIFRSTFSATAAALANCEENTNCVFVDGSSCENNMQEVIPDFLLRGNINCSRSDRGACRLRPAH
ncbi:hypothetical protein N9M16_01825 [Candidatus Dependentiae bacterium]|nr:hypothetical protein [Candidatus Dependentiae bacterium]